MNAPNPPDLEPSSRFNAALDEYDRLIDAGLTVDRSQFLEKYADVAGELRSHFEVADRLLELSASSVGRQSTFALSDLTDSFGDYEILEEVGRGGMGVIFKAYQKSLNRIVALKMTAGGQLSGEEEVARFRKEAEALAQLEHANIISVHEVGVHQGRNYFSMDYIDGVNLVNLLRDNPPSHRQAVEYAKTIAEAMDYAHRQGVVHRDLKPANIMLDSSGRIRITDFGLGKLLTTDDGLTQTGQILGTLRYMPPEQADGKEDQDTKAGDIYSIGAILYELLTGRPAFWSDSTVDIIRQIHYQEPVRLRQHDVRIPKDLETICLKCLNKSPKERYATAGDLANDLERFLSGEPVRARPISRPARMWRWCRHRPLVSSLIFLTMMAMVTGTVASTLFAVAAVRGQQEALEARRVSDQNADKALRQEKLAKAQLSRSEWLLYTSQIAQAQREWKDGNVSAAWVSLNACNPELRGWEHDYLYTLFTNNQRTLRGHARRVVSVAFSPDGKQLVSGSWDKTVKVWDIKTERELMTLTGHAEHVDCVAFSPDGQRIASASRDNTVKIWDAKTGRDLLTFGNHKDFVKCVVFSSDGTRIVSGSLDKTLKIWDPETGEEFQTLNGHTDDINCVAFHPNGRWIASGGSDDTIKVWDANTGRELSTLRGNAGDVDSITFSPDGQYLATGNRGGPIVLWRLADNGTAKPLISLPGHNDGVTGLVFSADGKRLFSCSYDGTLKVWDEPYGLDAFSLRGHAGNVFCVAISPDGMQIASGGQDHTLKIWDSRIQQEAMSLKGHESFVECVKFSNDGQWIASGSHDNTLKCWGAGTGKEIATYTGHSATIASVAISPNDEWVVTASEDYTLKIWNMNTGGEILTLTGHTGAVSCVAVSTDGKRIVSGSADATLKIWDAESGREMRTLTGHKKAVTCVAVSPDGARILSGSDDQVLNVWDFETGRVMLTFRGHSDQITCVAFSPNGKQIVSGSVDQTLKVWDTTSGEEMHTLRGHTGDIACVTFSPDGKRIVSGSRDETLRIWDAETGQETLAITGHRGEVTSVDFSPDGKRILSGSDDHFVKIWDARSRAPGTEVESSTAD